MKHNERIAAAERYIALPPQPKQPENPVNGWLIVLAILIGVGAALLAVAPQLMTRQ